MSQHVIVIHNMRAVGMHHHGPRPLFVGGRYCLRWEPDCVYDLGNAMAVLDHKGKVRAYLTRQDAAIVSMLCQADCVQWRMYCKPMVNAHVVQQNFGPQQESKIQLKC
jgi:hypothetical protein